MKKCKGECGGECYYCGKHLCYFSPSLDDCGKHSFAEKRQIESDMHLAMQKVRDRVRLLAR